MDKWSPLGLTKTVVVVQQDGQEKSRVEHDSDCGCDIPRCFFRLVGDYESLGVVFWPIDVAWKEVEDSEVAFATAR